MGDFTLKLNPGDSFLSESLIANAGTIFRGLPANIFSILDLTQFIEATITSENIYSIGWTSKDNPFAEEFIKLGILKSIREEIDNYITSEYPYDPGDFQITAFFESNKFAKSVIDFVRVLLDPNLPWSTKMFHMPIFDNEPGFESRSIETYKVAKGLAELETGVYGPKSKSQYEKEIEPQLNFFQQYVDDMISIITQFDIPIMSGTVEQHLVDIRKVDLTIPHLLLVEHYGKHYKKNIFNGFSAVPSLPFAGLVLGSSATIDEISKKIVEYREKYTNYRKTIVRFRSEMNNVKNAKTTRGLMEYKKLEDEFEKTITSSLEKIEQPYKPKKKLVFKIWDIVKPANPYKIFANLMDK